ncbi:MAG: hypothetical protein Q7U12_12710, partial [Undibacterium sp.]|nr:hypothetical protein [Undibacterium sp.]
MSAEKLTCARREVALLKERTFVDSPCFVRAPSLLEFHDVWGSQSSFGSISFFIAINLNDVFFDKNRGMISLAQ